MKIKTTLLPLFTAAFSVFGIVARFWLNTAGTDGEGLIKNGHPSVTVSVIIFAALVGTLALCAVFMKKPQKRFPASVPGAAGCFIGAVGLAITLFIDLKASGNQTTTGITNLLPTLSFLAGLGTVAAFAAMGSKRLQGKPVNIWFYVVAVVYFVIHLLQQYQQWSQMPQLTDYLFPVLGSVFLMLAFYHRAYKDLDQPDRWQYMFFSQIALFCCIMSIFGTNWVFYASMSAWLLLDSLPGKETT